MQATGIYQYVIFTRTWVGLRGQAPAVLCLDCSIGLIRCALDHQLCLGLIHLALGRKKRKAKPKTEVKGESETYLLVLDIVRFIHDNDLEVQVLVMALKLSQEVVGSYEAAEMASSQVGVALGVRHVHLVLCHAQPLHQGIHPLLCRGESHQIRQPTRQLQQHLCRDQNNSRIDYEEDMVSLSVPRREEGTIMRHGHSSLNAAINASACTE